MYRVRDTIKLKRIHLRVNRNSCAHHKVYKNHVRIVMTVSTGKNSEQFRTKLGPDISLLRKALLMVGNIKGCSIAGS
jgi:hypothetical protein